MKDAAAAQAALMASLPTSCTPLPMTASMAGFLAVNVILTFCMAVVIGLRAYVRVRGAGLGPDDYFVGAAFFLTLGFLSVQVIMSRCGLGHHISVGIVDLPFLLHITFFAQIIAVCSCSLVKLSMLCFYLRVFSTPKLRIYVWITMGLTVGYLTAFTFTAIFTCAPVSAQWDLSITDGKCHDTLKIFVALVYSNVVLDLIVMVLPIPTVLGLQMKRSDKVGVLVCLSITLITVVVAIVRGTYVTGIDLKGNMTGTIGPSVFMAVFDQILQVICVCIPTLRPLWRRWRGKSLSGSDYVHGSGNPSNAKHSGHRAGTGTISSSKIKRSRGGPSVMDPTLETYVEMDNISNDHFHDDGSSEKDLTAKETRKITAEVKWTVEQRI